VRVRGCSRAVTELPRLPVMIEAMVGGPMPVAGSSASLPGPGVAMSGMGCRLRKGYALLRSAPGMAWNDDSDAPTCVRPG